MKKCKACKYYDTDTGEDFGDCTRFAIWEIPNSKAPLPMMEDEDTCDRWEPILPPIISVTKSAAMQMYQVTILEWSEDDQAYLVAFLSNRYWTDIDDAIDEAQDRETDDMEYVAIDDCPYVVQL